MVQANVGCVESHSPKNRVYVVSRTTGSDTRAKRPAWSRSSSRKISTIMIRLGRGQQAGVRRRDSLCPRGENSSLPHDVKLKLLTCWSCFVAEKERLSGRVGFRIVRDQTAERDQSIVSGSLWIMCDASVLTRTAEHRSHRFDELVPWSRARSIMLIRGAFAS